HDRRRLTCHSEEGTPTRNRGRSGCLATEIPRSSGAGAGAPAGELGNATEIPRSFGAGAGAPAGELGKCDRDPSLVWRRRRSAGGRARDLVFRAHGGERYRLKLGDEGDGSDRVRLSEPGHRFVQVSQIV